MSGWIGLNAQLLSDRPTYRGAGIARYAHHLLDRLPAETDRWDFRAYVPPGLGQRPAHPRLRLVPSRLPTQQPLARLLWEQLVLPRLLTGAALHHGLAFALPRNCPVPAVVTFHDLSFLLFPKAFRRLRRWYLSFATRHAARRAAAVLTVSESTRGDTIRLLGVPRERVHAVPNGVEQSYRPLPAGEVEAFRAARSLPERFFLTVATLEPRKNLATLLEAYAALREEDPEAWPLLIGGAVGWHASPLFERHRELELRGAVRFLGYVPSDELPLWYNAATVFVYPSLYEGFGLPVVEAMACGTPVVTSNASSLPEVAGEAALLIDPRHAPALSQALLELRRHPDLRAELGQRGVVRAARYSWNATARQTLAVYDRVLA